MRDGSHLLQRGAASEIFHDVLNDRPELPARKYAVRRDRKPARTRGMAAQGNGQNNCRGLDPQRPPHAARVSFRTPRQPPPAELTPPPTHPRGAHPPRLTLLLP